MKSRYGVFKGILGGQQVVVVRSGIGKVNAGICTQILADVFQVNAVINTGIAGSLKVEINIGDIVLSTDTMQHDVDAREFGYEIGQVPRMDTRTFPADDRLRETALQVCRKVNPEIQVLREEWQAVTSLWQTKRQKRRLLPIPRHTVQRWRVQLLDRRLI